MKWVNHSACTFAGTYVLSSNLPLSFAVAAFSHLPDAIEYWPGNIIFRQHRGRSHSPALWICLLLASIFLVYTPWMQQAEAIMGPWGFGFTALWALVPALGGIFHLLEDSMSLSGIKMWKRKHPLALRLYKTGTRSEYFLVLGFVAACAFWEFLKWQVWQRFF